MIDPTARRAIVILSAVVSVASSASGQLKRVDADVEVPSVSVAELASSVEDGTISAVIDVRLEEDYDKDPVLIPSATWRDPNDIEAWAKELPAETKVVVYCVRGAWVSQSVTKKLRDMGFDVSQLSGGIEAWKASDKPTSPPQ